MAGDNVLAAILGVLDQSQKSTDLLMQDALYRRRKKEDLESEMALYPKKLALQTEAKRAESGIDLDRQKQIEQSKYDIAFPLETEKLKVKREQIQAVKDRTSNKPLTLEGKKVSGNLADGLRSVDTALKIQEKRPNINFKTGFDLPLIGDLPSRIASIKDPDAQRYMREVTNASDVLARYRTGAAINNQELATYKRLLNDAFADPIVARENLQKVREFFIQVDNDIQSGRRTYKESGESALPISTGNADFDFIEDD